MVAAGSFADHRLTRTFVDDEFSNTVHLEHSQYPYVERLAQFPVCHYNIVQGVPQLPCRWGARNVCIPVG